MKYEKVFSKMGIYDSIEQCVSKLVVYLGIAALLVGCRTPSDDLRINRAPATNHNISMMGTTPSQEKRDKSLRDRLVKGAYVEGAALFLWEDYDNNQKIGMSSETNEVLRTNIFYPGDNLMILHKIPRGYDKVYCTIREAESRKILMNYWVRVDRMFKMDHYREKRIDINELATQYQIAPTGSIKYEVLLSVNKRESSPMGNVFSVRNFSINYSRSR